MPDLNRNIAAFDPVVAHQDTDTFVLVDGLEGKNTTLSNMSQYIHSDWVLDRSSGTIDSDTTLVFVDAPTGNVFNVTVDDIVEYSVVTGIPNATNEYDEGSDFIGDEQLGFRIASGASSGQSGYSSIGDVAEYVLGKAANGFPSSLSITTNDYFPIFDTSTEEVSNLSITTLINYTYDDGLNALTSAGTLGGSDQLGVRYQGFPRKTTVNDISNYVYSRMDDLGAASALAVTDVVTVSQSGTAAQATLQEVAEFTYDNIQNITGVVSPDDLAHLVVSQGGEGRRVFASNFAGYVYNKLDDEPDVPSALQLSDYGLVNRSGIGYKATLEELIDFTYDELDTLPTVTTASDSANLVVHESGTARKISLSNLAGEVADTLGSTFTPLLDVDVYSYSFAASGVWTTVVIDAAHANRWVWMTFNSEEDTADGAMWYRSLGQTHGLVPEYECGRTAPGNIGLMVSYPVRLDGSGAISLYSTNLSTLRMTIRGYWE